MAGGMQVRIGKGEGGMIYAALGSRNFMWNWRDFLERFRLHVKKQGFGG